MSMKIKLNKLKQPNKFICSHCESIAVATGNVIDTYCPGEKDEFNYGTYEYKCKCKTTQSEHLWRDHLTIDFEWQLKGKTHITLPKAINNESGNEIVIYKENDTYYMELIT